MRLWIPGAITGERNRRRNANRWASSRRTARQRNDVLWSWRAALADGQVLPDPPWCVYLVRQSPRQLDSDNLGDAFKATRDQVAACLGLKSDVERMVRFFCEQRKGEPGIEIEVKTLTPRLAQGIGKRLVGELLDMIDEYKSKITIYEGQ